MIVRSNPRSHFFHTVPSNLHLLQTTGTVARVVTKPLIVGAD